VARTRRAQSGGRTERRWLRDAPGPELEQPRGAEPAGDLGRRLAAEPVGTGMLVVFGAGSVVAALTVNNDLDYAALGMIGVAFAVVIAVVISHRSDRRRAAGRRGLRPDHPTAGGRRGGAGAGGGG
jgi:hypothetical protein